MAGLNPSLEASVTAHLERGDINAAATAAIRGYGPEILGYMTAVLRSEELARDALAVFSERLWRGLATFRRESSVRTWAYRLAFNAAVDCTRDAKRHRAEALGSTFASNLAAEVRTQTATHLRTETKTAVQKLREELSLDEQTLLILRIDRQLEWDDVAEAMGTPAVTLRKRFERVKEKLRGLAKGRGVG